MNLNRIITIVLLIGFFPVISLILIENKFNTLVQKIYSTDNLTSQKNIPKKTISGMLSININPVNKTYNQEGQATAVESNGKTKVNLNLTEISNTGTQLANIRMGTCENPGKVVYKLNNAVRGNSITTINSTLNKILGDTPLIISINKSIYDNQDYTACGVLND